MWAAGCKLPTQVAEGCSVCFCGAAIGIGDVEPHALRVYAQSTPAFLKQAFHPLLMKTSLSHQTAMG